MIDKKPIYPEMTQVIYPDGHVYVYSHVVQDLEQGQYVEANANGKVIKFKGGMRFPRGITTERVAKGEYSLIIVQIPEKKEEPVIVAPGQVPPQ